MSEIDVTYCKFARLNDICARSPINTQECKCSKIPIQMCYYKQLQKEKEELKKLKDEILNKKPSEREYCKGCTLPAYSDCLDEIEEIVKNICDEECDFKWCKGIKHCGDDDCRYMQIMEKIKQAKEG